MKKVEKKKHDLAKKLSAQYGEKGKGHFTPDGGWRGNKAGGGKFESGFGGRDNS